MHHSLLLMTQQHDKCINTINNNAQQGALAEMALIGFKICPDTACSAVLYIQSYPCWFLKVAGWAQ
jgi:hypothetical protein